MYHEENKKPAEIKNVRMREGETGYWKRSGNSNEIWAGDPDLEVICIEAAGKAWFWLSSSGKRPQREHRRDSRTNRETLRGGLEKTQKEHEKEERKTAAERGSEMKTEKQTQNLPRLRSLVTLRRADPEEQREWRGGENEG